MLTIIFLLAKQQASAQFAIKLIKQEKLTQKFIPAFPSLEGNYLFINDDLSTDSLKLANTSYFAIERININEYNTESIKKDVLDSKEILQLESLHTVQNIEELKAIFSEDMIEAFMRSKKLKTIKEMVEYFKSKRSLKDYGFWYNLIETRRALGLVYLDNNIKFGDKYIYFITRVLKNNTIESEGVCYSISNSKGNYLLSEYKPHLSRSFALDSSINVSWKVPVNINKINAVIDIKSKEKDFMPLPFGEFNIRGAVYLQTNLGWEKAGMMFPSMNPTNDTLLFNYTAKAVPEKNYKIFMQVEDEVHNKGLESDTTSVFVISKNNLPIVTKVEVRDTLNGVYIKWNKLSYKPYIESIELTKSELNTIANKIYLKPTDTAYIDYDVEVGKTYIYGVKTIFLPQVNLKQSIAAEGTGKFTIFTNPLPPSNLMAKHAGNHIQLEWDHDSIPGFFGFFVYRGTSFDKLNLVAGPLYTNQFIDSASYLSGKSTYYYAIQSQNLKQVSSGYSNRVAIIPKRIYNIYKPNQLSYFYANNTLILKWEDVTLKDAYVNGYILQKKIINQNSFTTIGKFDALKLSYSDTSIERGVNYAYRIASTTVKGDTSEFTDPIIFSANKKDVAILMDFTARSITEGIEIALPTLIHENRKYYNIYRKEEGALSSSKIATLKPDDFIYIDKEVSMGKYYLYAISIVENDEREGKLSDEKAVKRD